MGRFAPRSVHLSVEEDDSRLGSFLAEPAFVRRFVVVAFCLAQACGTRAKAPAPSEEIERFRVAGEYEAPGGLLLAWTGAAAETTLEQVIGLASSRVPTTVIVDPSVGRGSIAERLRGLGIDTDAITFLEIPVEAPWMRDFGPIPVIGTRGNRALLDFSYPFRPEADDVPARIGEALWPEVTVVQSSFELDGGNLVTDGAGRCITARSQLDMSYDADGAFDLLIDRGICASVVMVPALKGEPTGHADMFMFSPGPGRVVVGQYTRDRDAENAAILDQAAAILDQAGLEVVRIPMPDNGDGRFRSYTNLLALGDLILVPVYDDESENESRALAIISQAYPGREIVAVEAGDSIELEGALHCLGATVPAVF